MSRSPGAYSVTGPAFERSADTADLGVSAATTYANRHAIRREEATYYVRDGDGVAVGRAEAFTDGSVHVHFDRTLDRASGSAPRGRGLAPRRSAGTSGSAEESEGDPRRRSTALPAAESPRTRASGTAVLSVAAGTPSDAKRKEKGMTHKDNERGLDEDLAVVARVTAKQAAVEALRRARGPLKGAEIARRVIKTSGVRLKAEGTPAATVTAMLSVESRKPDGVFVRTEKGTYDLRERAHA